MPLLWLALKKLRSEWSSYEEVTRDFAAIGPSAVPKLTAILDERTDVHPNRRVIVYARAKAINAIGKIGDPRAVPALIRALGDVEPFIVYCAAEALEKFDTPEAIDALEKRALQKEQDRQEQIYYVRGFRPHEDRWWMDVILVSPYQSGMLDGEHWTFWKLGPDLHEINIDKDMTVYEDDNVMVNRRWQPPSPEQIYRSAVVREWRIERVPPELTVGSFLAVVPKGVPCAFQVEIRLAFLNWADFPDSVGPYLRAVQQGRERRRPHDDFEGQQEKRVQYIKPPPESGQDMPVSVQFDDHSYLGILCLRERIEGEPDSEERTFRAELHFTETVPDLPPGTILTRTVIWHEWLSDRSVTREVATILSATRLPDGV